MYEGEQEIRTSPNAMWQQALINRLNYKFNVTFLISPNRLYYSALKDDFDAWGENRFTRTWVFQCDKSNSSTTIQQVCNESANFSENTAVYIDINGPSNLCEMVPVIGMGYDVTRPPSFYTKLLDAGPM